MRYNSPDPSRYGVEPEVVIERNAAIYRSRLPNARLSIVERRFGWGRQTVAQGLQEARSGIHCLNNYVARGRCRCEQLNPQLADDIRALVEPQTYTDRALKSTRRYSNLTAAEVLQALRTRKGYQAADLPKERTMRDMLNRFGFRLKRIPKGKPLQKTKDTGAIFAHVQAVKAEAQKDQHTLEISVDTRTKVAVGEYVRGGKKPDRG